MRKASILAFLVGFLPLFSALVIDLYYRQRISMATSVDPEIVNGLLTVSGIVFGFQIVAFGSNQKNRTTFILLFIVESVFLVITGYSYIFETLETSHLSTKSLMFAFFSLVTNMAYTFLFLGTDLIKTNDSGSKQPTA